MGLSFGGKKTNGTSLSNSSVTSDSQNLCNCDSFWRRIVIFFTLPRGIFAVSLFGLFLGASTTLIYSQLGLFLKNELCVTEAKIASLDGFVEFIAYSVRIISGIVSDYLRNRKAILIIGCFITLFMKPLFAIAQSIYMIIFAQSVERVGNGLQAVPRDALVADLSDTKTRARSFGFCKSFKTLGALLGTCTAMGIMYLSSNDYRLVFCCATIPVVIAIICLSQIKENDSSDSTIKKQDKKIENPFKFKYLKSLDWSFWKLLLLATIFELGHFSEAILPIYNSKFLPITYAGSVSIFISLGQVLLCYPIGILADKYNKRIFIRACMFFMIVSNTLFYFADFVNDIFLFRIGNVEITLSVINIWLGAFLWGGQMSSVQGLFLSLVSEKVDSHLRGTAIGIYYLFIGGGFLIASAIGGNIWTNLGPQYAFFYSIAISTFSLIIFNLLLPKNFEKQCVIA